LTLLAAARPVGAGETPAADPAPPQVAPVASPTVDAPAVAEPPAAEPPAPAGPVAVEPAPIPPAPPAAPPPTAGGTAAVPALGEDLVITATRSPRPVRDVPESVTIVTSKELEQSPAKTLDEVLAAVPSFDLFRRSSSLAADPSSQGVKLRGVGGTAVARTLVLLDGVPVNDSFAGWVPWRAFPSLSLERIEVVPGGGAALYGNYALGGVVQLISRPIEARTSAVEVEGGSFGTGRFEAHVADRAGPVGVAIDGEIFGSRGYLVVDPAFRGPVDQSTVSQHQVVSARMEGRAANDLQLTARASFFHQDQNGGTTFTTSEVKRLDYSAGAAWTPSAGRLALTVFGHGGEFDQGRTRITNPGRVSEVSSGVQAVPAHDLGTSLVWQAAPIELVGAHAL
jgi:outer membrane receptor protein involved in Fe transport